MADSSHLRVLQFGVHASANDFTADAGATVFLDPVGQIDVSGLTQTKHEKDTLRGDNEMNTRVNGPKEMPFSFSLLGQGLNTQDGGAMALADQQNLGELLEIAFGAGASFSGNATPPTIASDAEATPSLTLSSGNGFSEGEAVGTYMGASSTEWIIREHVSGTGATLTVDRGGWSGSESAQAAYGSMSLYVDGDSHDDVHGYFDVEGENFRREIHGAMCETCVINIPSNGGQVTFDFSFRGSDWTDTTEANPTYSAPAVGSDIIALNSPFYMGDGGTTYADDTEWFVDSLTITITNELQPRTTPSGANGFAGYHVAKRTVTMAGNLYLGALTSDATDALLSLLNTSTQTMDVGMQVGSGPGASMYVRAPALDMDATLTTINGMDAIAFTGVCRRSPNHSNVPGAFRLHLL
jgi:hypothetical protein